MPNDVGDGRGLWTRTVYLLVGTGLDPIKIVSSFGILREDVAQTLALLPLRAQSATGQFFSLCATEPQPFLPPLKWSRGD